MEKLSALQTTTPIIFLLCGLQRGKIIGIVSNNAE
jgi:hypothetical protein